MQINKRIRSSIGADESALIGINRRKAQQMLEGEGGEEWPGWPSGGEQAERSPMALAQQQNKGTLSC